MTNVLVIMVVYVLAVYLYVKIVAPLDNGDNERVPIFWRLWSFYEHIRNGNKSWIRRRKPQTKNVRKETKNV